LEKIEINNVTSQHHASVLSSGSKEQSVIQSPAALVFTISLQTAENARGEAGFTPYLGVRHNRSVAGAPFDHGGNLFDNLAGSWITWIK